MGDLHEVLWGLAFRGKLNGGPPRSPLGTGFSGKFEWGTAWEVLWGLALFPKLEDRPPSFVKKNNLVFDNLAYYVGRGAARAANLFYGVDDC